MNVGSRLPLYSTTAREVVRVLAISLSLFLSVWEDIFSCVSRGLDRDFIWLIVAIAAAPLGNTPTPYPKDLTSPNPTFSRFRAEEMTGKHVELDLGLNKSHIFLVLSFYVVLLLHVLFSPFSAHVLAGITVYQTQKCFTQLSYLGTVNGKRQSQKRDKRLDTRPYVSIQRKFRYFYSHAIARAHGTPWGCINTYCVPCWLDHSARQSTMLVRELRKFPLSPT